MLLIYYAGAFLLFLIFTCSLHILRGLVFVLVLPKFQMFRSKCFPYKPRCLMPPRTITYNFPIKEFNMQTYVIPFCIYSYKCQNTYQDNSGISASEITIQVIFYVGFVTGIPDLMHNAVLILRFQGCGPIVFLMPSTLYNAGVSLWMTLGKILNGIHVDHRIYSERGRF